jgi:hypothetical protein
MGDSLAGCDDAQALARRPIAAADSTTIVARTGESNEDDEETGPWGETWPEKS